MSYTLNNYFRSVDPVNGPNFDSRQGVEKITDVVQPATKVLIIEEDEHTIDDGFATIFPYTPSGSAPNPVAWASNPFTNLLSNRHDLGRKTQADTVTAAVPVPNLQCKGNAGFCDGHAEFVPRSYVHSKYHEFPDVVGSPWGSEPDFPGATP
jgi:prepilin-type processing-associated H-X9-DG protein